MSENNRSAASAIPLGFLVVVILIYQNRNAILKFLEELFIGLMWICVAAAVVAAVMLSIYLVTTFTCRKIIQLRKWIRKVNELQEAHAEEIKLLADQIRSLGASYSNQQRKIADLSDGLKKLSTEVKPAPTANKVVADQKVFEAAIQIME